MMLDSGSVVKMKVSEHSRESCQKRAYRSSNDRIACLRKWFLKIERLVSRFLVASGGVGRDFGLVLEVPEDS
jgi:hypothetical protein